MRIHRVHLPTLQAGEIVLTGSEAHHLAKVLRVNVGQEIRAFDGKGLESTGVIQSIDEFQVVLNLQEPKASDVEATLKITLAIALLKGDKLADVVRQATELGVIAVQPLITKYCDVKELSGNKLERLRRVAREASKQSGRSVVPAIREAITLQNFQSPSNILVAHPYASSSLNELAPLESHQQQVLSGHRRDDDNGMILSTLKILRNDLQLNSLRIFKVEPADGSIKGGWGDLAIVTGPEGGLAQEEIEALVTRGATPVRLGARILRAETAPIALIAALLLPDAL